MAASAVAADAVAPNAGWTGFYIGADRGMSFASLDYFSNGTLTTEYGYFNQVMVGGIVGYDKQIGDIVFGIEGDANAKFGGGQIDDIKSRPTSDWDLSVRPRVGVLVSPRTLVYATGGLAIGHFSTPPQENSPLDTYELLGGMRMGWTAGGGLQYAFDSNWSGRIEYRYTGWGNKLVNGAPASGPASDTSSNLSDHRVMMSLLYKLGSTGIADDLTKPDHDWNGLYVGLQGGGVASTFSYDDSFGAGGEEFADFTQEQLGAHAGFNYVTNNILVGLEGDINAKFGQGYKYSDNLRPTSDWDGSIRARLGILPTPQNLLYVTGGLAFGNFTTPLAAGAIEVPEEHLGGSRIGWTIGTGTEYAFDSKWTASLEYRYTDWGTKLLDNTDGFVSQIGVPSRLTDNRVTVGVSYSF